MSQPLIVLTNDDGFHSPGLWAAARAVADFAEILVVAPHEQQSGAGRSMPRSSRGTLRKTRIEMFGREWSGYAVHGTPAQAVQHAVLELAPRRPDLLISGINYGENVGTGVTISGTVGAALEAATFGVPGLAVSLETDKAHHYTHSPDLDFGAAAHFTRLFAQKLLALPRPPDVDALKLEIPRDATADTPWRMTRVSRQRYFEPVKPTREDFEADVSIDYALTIDDAVIEQDSDVYALVRERVVAVTPLSLDLTSRVDLKEFERAMTGAG